MTRLDFLGIPALVDDMKDTANEACRAWPDRLYRLGKDGKIAYQGGRGPFGFRPEELATAIVAELKKTGRPVPKPVPSVDTDPADVQSEVSTAH